MNVLEPIDVNNHPYVRDKDRIDGQELLVKVIGVSLIVLVLICACLIAAMNRKKSTRD